MQVGSFILAGRPILSQPFLVSSRNAPPHKRLLTFEQHSFPFVVFTLTRSLTLFLMWPIRAQEIFFFNFKLSPLFMQKELHPH